MNLQLNILTEVFIGHQYFFNSTYTFLKNMEGFYFIVVKKSIFAEILRIYII